MNNFEENLPYLRKRNLYIQWFQSFANAYCFNEGKEVVAEETDDDAI